MVHKIYHCHIKCCFHDTHRNASHVTMVLFRPVRYNNKPKCSADLLGPWDKTCSAIWEVNSPTKKNQDNNDCNFGQICNKLYGCVAFEGGICLNLQADVFVPFQSVLSYWVVHTWAVPFTLAGPYSPVQYTAAPRLHSCILLEFEASSCKFETFEKTDRRDRTVAQERSCCHWHCGTSNDWLGLLELYRCV